MIFYIFVIVLISFVCFLFKTKSIKNTKKKIILTIILSIIIFITGFRGVNVGNDTISYVSFFKVLSNDSIDILEVNFFEKGFILYNVIINKIFSDYRALLLISSTLISIPIFLEIYKKSYNIWLSTMLYINLMFFFNSMNIMRQFIALSIVFCFLKYVEQRKFFKFLFGVLLASTFHQTAIIAIVYYFIYDKKMNLKHFFILLFTSFVIFINIETIFYYYTFLFPKRYIVYEQRLNDINIASILDLIVSICFFILSLLLFKTKIKKIEDKDNNINFYINATFVSVLINILAVKLNVLNRISIYFSIFNILLIPNVLSYIKNSKTRNIIITIIFLLTCMYAYIILKYRPEWYNAIPYTIQI
ncbi:MAG: EpsG family protein [Tissierellia bacterium]|nr:EpsG family protein [Tissierellia bacterium]